MLVAENRQANIWTK